ncbi:MAG: hypothetical protein KGO96_14240 [Elusimicrobia bacterium]|nr:hypothetical protein [Elusimicrobiota bacterium]MDE2427054.1 hypothetical protein [Elusimicrobiota bacterium]
MDSLYRVILSLESQGNLGTNVGHLTQKLHEAHGGVSHLREGLSSMGEALERVADKAFEVTKHIAEIGLGAGLAAAAYGVAHLNRSLEETNLSLATVFQTQGFASNFNDALKLSQEQLGKMKQDVKSLPGDLGQLSDIMKMIATPAAQGGANADQIRALAGRGMLVSRILGVPQEVAARELAQLFAGRAGSHNILGGRMGLVGEEAQRFNKESAQQRVAEITKLFNTPAMNSAAEAFSHTWTAQITTLADNTKYLMLAPATSGLFERVKHSIEEVNGYIDSHKQKIEEVASLVNRRLVSAWDELESIVKRLAPIVGPMLDKIAHMQPAELGHYVERAGEAMLGAKIGGMLLSGAGSALGMVGRFGAMGGGGAMAGLGAMAGEALPALGAAAVVAAPAIIAAAGAFDILTDKNSVYHAEAVNTAEDIGQVWGRVGENLQRALLPAEHASERVADKMGILALEGLDKAAIYAERVTIMLDHLSEGMGHFADVLKYGLGQLEAIKKFRETQPEELTTPTIDKDVGLLHLIRMAPHEGPGAGKSGAKTGAGGGGGGTNIQKVEIVVKGNDDPSRVARLTVKELEKFARNPRQSRYVPEYSRP